MKLLFVIVVGGLFLTSISFTEIIITDAQVVGIQIKQAKKDQGELRTNKIVWLTLKVRAWKQGRAHNQDQQIIDFLNNKKIIEVNQEKALADNSDELRFLKESQSHISNKIKPNMNVVGRLLPYNKNTDISKGSNELVILLRNPTYTSSNGVATILDNSKSRSPFILQNKLKAPKLKEATLKVKKGKFELADFANTKWTNHQNYILEFDETGENTTFSYNEKDVSQKTSAISKNISIRMESDPQIIVGTYHFLKILNDGKCLLPDGSSNYPKDCFIKK